jgi:hypothetical protein
MRKIFLQQYLPGPDSHWVPNLIEGAPFDTRFLNVTLSRHQGEICYVLGRTRPWGLGLDVPWHLQQRADEVIE